MRCSRSRRSIRSTALGEVPSLTFRPGGAIVAHQAHGTFTGFPDMPFPAWDLLPLDSYTLPLEGKPYVIDRDEPRLSLHLRLLRRAALPRPQVPRARSASASSRRSSTPSGRWGIEHFYLWGDTVTLNAKTFARFCDELIARKLDIRWFGNARADNLTSLEFVQRLRESGCWMLSMGIESESAETRKNMVKRLEEEKIRPRFKHLRQTGIKSFAFFIYGYPGETLASMERTTQYALDSGSGLRELLSGRAVSRDGALREGAA